MWSVFGHGATAADGATLNYCQITVTGANNTQKVEILSRKRSDDTSAYIKCLIKRQNLIRKSLWEIFWGNISHNYWVISIIANTLNTVEGTRSYRMLYIGYGL